MVRAIVGAALAVHWIAQELICLGQMLIRMAYGWLRWAERHVSSPARLPARSPSPGVPMSESADCRSPP